MSKFWGFFSQSFDYWFPRSNFFSFKSKLGLLKVKNVSKLWFGVIKIENVEFLRSKLTRIRWNWLIEGVATLTHIFRPAPTEAEAVRKHRKWWPFRLCAGARQSPRVFPHRSHGALSTAGSWAWSYSAISASKIVGLN